MRTIVFATNNAHKLSELRALAGDSLCIRSLSDIGCTDDIPETGDTLRDNALQKARWVASRYGCDCFADDTGLEVEALGGEPGVHSARYAPGTDHDSAANMRHLLERMDGLTDRRACFRTVIALIIDGREHLFEGRVDGEILTAPEGDGGFGYDPLFRPEGWDKTFGSASAEAKNSVSHRARATARLIQYLKTL
ncbi:MAG: non-canonical purine NTP diphosphatase [Bacteroides sp.]|nr:non-canonical purine NTP diphosphatase [Bacteroides sp.]MCM1094964.1 non-canonical purine NTP diphosphatase [Terasakiella sp.]